MTATSPMRVSATFLLSLLGLVLCGPAHAQTAVGRVVDAESGAPVEAVLVVLSDSSGTRQAGGLTDAGGEFRIRASAPGAYTLTAERIGYATPGPRRVELERDRGMRVDLELVPLAIELEGIEVYGERRCVVRPEDGLVVAELWEEASKALRNQEWNEREARIRFELRTYVREIHPRTRTVLSERREPSRWTTGEPFRSYPAEDILATGFVHELDDGFRYVAPDAGVLLSDAFLDTHCWRLSGRSPEAGLIGLEFEPVEDRPVPEIRGTLWLSADGARPRHLEYEYTWAPSRIARGVAGGRVEFEELPGGNWIVRRWSIRMPRVVFDANSAVGEPSGYRIAAVVEEGGEVGRIRPSGGSLRGERPVGTIVGVVVDSTHARPVPDAVVALSGTGHEVRSDSAGRFRFAEVPIGTHTLTLGHATLHSVADFVPAGDVVVLEAETTEIQVALPDARALHGAICPGESGESAVVGVVRDVATDGPVPRATVTLEWEQYRAGARELRDLRADLLTRRVTTDRSGRYRACGIPAGVALSAVASIGGSEGRSRSPRLLPWGGVARLDLTVDAGASAPPLSVTGRIFDRGSGQPIAAADVVLQDVEGRPVGHASSRADGRFRVKAPAPGSYRIEVQRMGYEPSISSPLELSDGESLTVEYAMTQRPIPIGGLDVTVPPEAFIDPRLEMHGYYARKDYYGRRTGFAHFLDGDDLQIGATDVQDLLRELTGVSVAGGGGRDRVTFDRRGCRMNFFVNGQLVRRRGENWNISRMVPAAAVVAIEVYTGRMMPLEFMTLGERAECGAVAIWTGSRREDAR